MTYPVAYFHFIPGQKHKPVSHAPLAVSRGARSYASVGERFCNCKSRPSGPTVRAPTLILYRTAAMHVLESYMTCYRAYSHLPISALK